MRRPGAGVVSQHSLHNTQQMLITLQNYSELNSQPSPSILKTVARIHSKELSIASPAIYIDESINSVECKEIIEDDDKEDRKLILFIRRLFGDMKMLGNSMVFN